MSEDLPPTPEEQTPDSESDRIARLRARSAGTLPTASSEPATGPVEPVDTPGEPTAATPQPPATGPLEAPGARPEPPAARPEPPADAAEPSPAAVEAPAAAPEPSAAPVPATAPVEVGPAPRRSPVSAWLAAGVAAAVLAATATALAGVVTARVSSANAVEHTRSDVIGAATSGVATVLSYDYRHLDADFAAAERLLTPHFRKQYDDTTGKGVRPLAAKYKAISSADVSAAGVVEAERDRAVVLVFVNQTVTNSQLTAPRLDRSRIDVTLVRSHGRWLIDKLTTL